MGLAPVRPKIPDVVPLDKADPERQKLYGGLKTEAAIEPAKPPAPAVSLEKATEEDKKEFVRALLGRVPFTKDYTLFGRVKVKLGSRTVAQTEKLYELTAQTPEPERDAWFHRYQLLSVLKEVKDPGHGNYFDAPVNLLDGDWREGVERFLLTLPLPMYSALIDLSVAFEALFDELVDAADKPGFWPTVGPN